jgi:hypothetical protein
LYGSLGYIDIEKNTYSGVERLLGFDFGANDLPLVHRTCSVLPLAGTRNTGEEVNEPARNRPLGFRAFSGDECKITS